MTGINIVFDGPPSHDGGRFVEIEDDAGNAVRVGEWAEDPRPGHEGLWRLRVSLADLMGLGANQRRGEDLLAAYEAAFDEEEEH